ncbi:unnamed protein product, partial [Oppiella nova]
MVDKPLKPVMVWFYGGGFVVGSIFQFPNYNGSVLATHDIVFVSINYRLGEFGFMYSGDESAPGNMGLYDQQLALQWVKKHIHKFGGDPNMVTIFGESAGSWSVSAHILSPLSKGLFRRAIMESAAQLSSRHRPIITKTEAISYAKQLANHFNCTDNKWVQCLRGIDATLIQDYHIQTNNTYYINTIIGTDILPYSAQVAFEKKEFNRDIELIAGVTELEGSAMAYFQYPILQTDNVTKQDFNDLVQQNEPTFHNLNVKNISEFYLRDIDDTNSSAIRHQFFSFYGDVLITCPTYLFAKLFAQNTAKENNVFFYEWTYGSSDMAIDKIMGVTHGADLRYTKISIKDMNPWNENLLKMLEFLCYIHHLEINSYVDVNTSSGIVRGQTIQVLNQTINEFLGIPFAEPPVGDLSEDCLVLNIWSPQVSDINVVDKPLKPVMVWIYGGGFTFGSIFQFPTHNGSVLATHDIVFVSINYRLGAFGFLYSSDESSPGNMGLYDQQLALQWVKQDIHKFGGDPNMVTIFGESAGSWSVSVHILSPLSKGLFRRAIMESAAQLEDCLVLNIWSPPVSDIKVVDKPLKPVMVWIYGGAFVVGSIFQFPNYNGSVLATHDIVFVSINYRLGAFGFLYSGDESSPGNMGLYDQQLALQWVKQNIHKFGGDPDMVTIFGESAGSWSVSAHILSPLSKGLFRRAIMESAAQLFSKNRPLITKTEAISDAKQLADHFNCTDDKWIQCLRGIDATLIQDYHIQTNNTYHINAIIGTDILPYSAQVAFEKKEFNRDIELIAGTTELEGSALAVGPTFHTLNVRNITEYYLRDIDDTNSSAIRHQFFSFYGDVLITCPTYLFAKLFAQNTAKENNVFFYEWTYKSSDTPIDQLLGVTHGAELPYKTGFIGKMAAFDG